MRTETITVLKFEELSEEVQSKLINKEQNSNREIFLDSFHDDCIQQIEETGFYSSDKIELRYSLGYSQGDGLSFHAENFSKIKEIIEQYLPVGKNKTAEIIYNYCVFDMEKRSRSVFASKSDIDFYLEVFEGVNYSNIQKIVNKVRDHIEYLYIGLCKELEKNGYAEIEYQSTDEYIKEELVNMDFDYLENGHKINLQTLLQ